MLSKSRLHILRLNRVPILEQLCLEEALFRADRRNWLIVNHGCLCPAIVMGISGVAGRLVDVDRAKLHKVPIIRRYTGGGTVIVDDGTVFISLLCNKADAPGTPQFPRELMRWSADALYGPVFQNFIAPGTDFSLQEHDYCISDLKVGGNAQTISRDRWVHHTSFLWSFSEARMSMLRMPEKRPEYRRNRPHGEFLTTLQSVAPTGADRDSFTESVVRQLSTMFDPQDASLDDALMVMAASTERQATHVVEV